MGSGDESRRADHARRPRRPPPAGPGFRLSRRSGHSSSERSDEEPDAAGSSSAPSAIASSTAESKSSPSSSPNSLPIFFMNRATLEGSFSSKSPMSGESASDSSRASSDFTVAKRDIRRWSAVPPQRGHVGAGAVDGRSTSQLSRRRQSPHSYS